jgi:hypothetical protein
MPKIRISGYVTSSLKKLKHAIPLIPTSSCPLAAVSARVVQPWI